MKKLVDPFVPFIGSWRGTNSLWLSPDASAQKSATTLTLAPAIEGKFLEIKYTWIYDDQPQEGLLLIGYEAELVTAIWADSWHMGKKFMQCQGVIKENGSVDVRGQYQAPPGPDWGWRIVLEHEGENTLNLTMYNITPEGQEALAVEAVYSRN